MTTLASQLQLPPGPKGLPFFGSALAFQRDPLRFVRRLQREYGSMATVSIRKLSFVFCFRPEHVRYFLTEQQKNFKKVDRGRNNLRRVLGDGLLTIDGDYHRQQRRLVQPAFHKRRIESYANVMTQYTEEMLTTWQPSTEIDMSQAMQQLTLRIIGQTLFNVDLIDRSGFIGQAFTDLIERPSGPFRSQIRVPFFTKRLEQKAVAGKGLLDDFVYELIRQRRASGQDTGDVLSMLLAPQEEGNSLSDKQIHDHVLTFVAAGHETAQNTLSWIFYLLSRNPAVRKKLQEELHVVLGGRTPTVEDLPHLPYLEWTINEAWRMMPPAWIISRQAIEAFDLDGYHFPPGTVILLSQWVIHNLPDVWGDPEVFRPERWQPEETQRIPHGAFFPFGMGPRICIGMPFAEMETRLLLATILQHFTPELVPGFPVVPLPRVTLRPKYGMRMILEPATNVGSETLVSPISG
jgi:cytochrome P450